DIDVEKGGVPGVIDHGCHEIAARRMGVADEIVEGAAHGAEAALGIAEEEFRRVEALARLEIIDEVVIVDTEMDNRAAVAGAFGKELPVAAPVQRAEPQGTAFLACAEAGASALGGEIGDA